MQSQLEKVVASQTEVQVVTDNQARITNLERASGEAREKSESCYGAIAEDSRLAPIKEKIALGRVEEQSFMMLASQEKPQSIEKDAVLLWGTQREQCDREMLNSSKRFSRPQLHLLREAGVVALRNLTVALFQGQLTFGEFAKLRQENASLSRSAMVAVETELRKESEESRLRAQQIANQSQQILIDAARVEALNRSADALDTASRRAPPVSSQGVQQMQTTNCNRMGSQITCQTY